MKRRDFVASLFTFLATLPFLGWLKESGTSGESGTLYARKLMAGFTQAPGITTEFMRNLHDYAKKNRITPFIDSKGEKYYCLGYNKNNYHIYRSRLTRLPPESIL